MTFEAAWAEARLMTEACATLFALFGDRASCDPTCWVVKRGGAYEVAGAPGAGDVPVARPNRP